MSRAGIGEGFWTRPRTSAAAVAAILLLAGCSGSDEQEPYSGAESDTDQSDSRVPAAPITSPELISICELPADQLPERLTSDAYEEALNLGVRTPIFDLFKRLSVLDDTLVEKEVIGPADIAGADPSELGQKLVVEAYSNEGGEVYVTRLEISGSELPMGDFETVAATVVGASVAEVSDYSVSATRYDLNDFEDDPFRGPQYSVNVTNDCRGSIVNGVDDYGAPFSFNGKEMVSSDGVGYVPNDVWEMPAKATALQAQAAELAANTTKSIVDAAAHIG